MTESTQAKDQADLEARVKGFNDELSPLLAKYRLALGALPEITGEGRLAAKPQLFDADKLPKKEEEGKESNSGLSEG